MKFLSFLVFFIIFSVVFVSCIQEEKPECVNGMDCPDGYVCLESTCIFSASVSDENNNDKDILEKPDNQIVETDNISDKDILELLDEDSIPNDMDELPDNELLCNEDSCSGNGECEVVDGKIKCTCDEGYTGAVCADCKPGSHLEAEGDDENGDGKRSCVKNVICTSNPDPCNGGSCTELDFTVTCNCTAVTGYTGRWCSDCNIGYLKSTVDSKCKPDCATGSYNCTGSKTCVVDAVKNEAGCVCKEFFSGTDCTSCDAAHFCSNHGTCAASGENAVCTCNEAWTGNATCSTCGQGYLADGANCIAGCEYYCGSKMGAITIGGTLYFIVADSNGKCEIKSGKAECVCDAGWKDSLHYTIPGQIKPACSDCDTANPPVGGCPE